MAKHSRTLFALLLVAGCSGCAAMRRAHVPEAIDTCRQLSRQGLSAMALGKWNEAETLLRSAADAAPSDADARRHLAEALWSRGDHQAAVAQMDEARLLQPEDGEIAVRAGQMHLEIAEFDQAQQCAVAAVTHAPQLAESWLLRGQVAARQGNASDALADLHRAIALAPTNTIALSEIAAVHHSRGDHHRCLMALHQLLDCYPPGREPQHALLLEGQTYLALSRPFEAADSLGLAATRGPASAHVACVRAEAALACGDFAAAHELAQEAIALDAQHPPAQALVAKLAGGSQLR